MGPIAPGSPAPIGRILRPLRYASRWRYCMMVKRDWRNVLVAKNAGTRIASRTAGELDRQIGARVRERRLEVGLSQTQLAEALGITFQQIQKYEKGVNRVAAVTLYQISRVLNTPLMSLIPRSGTAASSQGSNDDPANSEILILSARLNPEGRAVLVDVARALARQQSLLKKR